MAEKLDPYHRWLGIPPEDQPADYYQLLGAKRFEADLDVLESAADRQMAHVRTFASGEHAKLSQKVLNELSQARIALLTPEKKDRYDEQLRKHYAKSQTASEAAKSQATTDSPNVATDVGVAIKASPRTTAKKPARRKGLPLGVLLGLGLVALIAVAAAVAAVMRSNSPDPRGDIADASATDTAATDSQSTGSDSTGSPSSDSTVADSTSTTDSGSDSEATGNDSAPPDGTTVDQSDQDPNDSATSEEPAESETADSPETVAESSTSNPPANDPTAPSDPAVQADATAAAAKKHPAPDEAAQQAALKMLTEAVNLEEGAADPAALAEKLSTLAKETEDPIMSFVMLDQARLALATAGFIREAMQSAEQIHEQYEVESAELNRETLDDALRTATPQQVNPQLVLVGLPIAHQLLEGEQYEEASALADKLHAIARRAKVPLLLERTTSLRRESDKLAKAHKRIRVALEKLSEAPNDATANTALAEFYLRHAPDWNRALPYLAKSDLAAAAIAQQELDANGAASDTLAEAWWNVSKKERANKELADVFLGRAVSMYAELMATSSGLQKAGFQKRIREGLSKPLPFAARHHFLAPPNLMDLVQEVDIRTEGDWRQAGADTEFTTTATIQVPVRLSANAYEVNLLISRKADYGLHLVLPVGEHYVKVIFASKYDLRSKPHGSLEIVNGRNHWRNGTRKVHANIDDGNPHLCTVQVQHVNGNAKIELFLDRKRVTGWEGPAAHLRATGQPSSPEQVILVLSNGKHSVHQLSIIPADGIILPTRSPAKS